MSGDPVFLIVSLALGALFVALAIPLVRRKVPPNQWYGLRVPATFADRRVWYEANARAGKDLLVLGVLVVVLGVTVYYVPMPSWISLILWTAWIVGGALAVAVRGWFLAERLLEDYEHGSGHAPPESGDR